MYARGVIGLYDLRVPRYLGFYGGALKGRIRYIGLDMGFMRGPSQNLLTPPMLGYPVR